MPYSRPDPASTGVGPYRSLRAPAEDREHAHDQHGKGGSGGEQRARPAELLLEDVEEEPEREQHPDEFRNCVRQAPKTTRYRGSITPVPELARASQREGARPAGRCEGGRAGESVSIAAAEAKRKPAA